jgi:uncharacterized membrane protein YphA (DoxX/SURF4 family)
MGDFIVGRPPAWTERYSPPHWIIFFANTLLILSGLLIIVQRLIEPAALLIASCILLLSFSRHFPQFLKDWTNAYKTTALLGGSLIIGVTHQMQRRPVKSMISEPWWRKDLLYLGILLMAVFLLSCGYAHFKFADFVIHFIPDYIPFHSFWTYLSGICLFAAGIGFFLPNIRPLAARLAGIMVLSWFFLLHIPRLVAQPGTIAEAMGLFESLSFSGILLVLSGLTPRQS